MGKFIFFVFLFVHHAASTKVIYELSKEDYYRMPPKNSLDRFEPCLGVSGGVYCTVNTDLVADEPNELLDMINAYSAHDTKHLNYSNIVHGLCLSKNCRKYYHGDNSQAALQTAAEACINETLSREYGLKSRVSKMSCFFHGEKNQVDTLDVIVAALIGTIMGLNVLGTIYDFFVRDENKPDKVNNFLMLFSIRVNWNRLVAPASSEPRQVQLRAINGVRVITSILVILGHVPVGTLISVENPTWFESAYRITLYHVLYQGHLITLTFFLISGFLLTYNVSIMMETKKFTWKALPMAVFVRWLRLSPVNIITLLLTATWLKFSDFGPYWHDNVGREINDCRNYWYYNIFYVNNLIDFSQCNLQTWSLASDMQLHAVGLAVVVAGARSALVRRALLAVLYLLGCLWPAYVIYTLDLDGTFLATPNTMIDCFLSSSSFNYIYKRTYSSLPPFVMGMALGYVIYDLQKRNLIVYKYQKYRVLYWLLLPSMMATVVSAYFFYFQDAPRPPMSLRLLFTPIIKPLFAFHVMLFIVGAIFRVEDVYRGILEWNGWVPLSRVSYCMYAIHVTVVRYLGGTKHTLSYYSLLHTLQEYAGIVVLTIILATAMFLTIEAPLGGVIKMFTASLMSDKRGSSMKSSQEDHNNSGQAKESQINGHGKPVKNGVKQE